MMGSPFEAPFVYPEELEPIATSEEVVVYEREVEAELEEEAILTQRFSNEAPRDQWCTCSLRCSLTKITKKEECFCCQDIDRCREKLEEIFEEEELNCITEHPGFKSVCLNKWVLETAAIGLKTRKGRSYAVMRENRQTCDSQFFRSVAYRQFYRLIWEYPGNFKRLPLPCCVYNAIRSEFPSEDDSYKGFLEEDEQEEEESETYSESEEELQIQDESASSALRGSDNGFICL